MSEAVHSILFICNMNSVRSPMAAFMMAAAAGSTMQVDSAGLYSGWLDPFTEEVMREVGVSMEAYASKRLGDIEPDAFDLIIAMTPEAAGEIRKLVSQEKLEYWPIENPSTETGGREAVLAAYRGVRDEIRQKIARRFPQLGQKA